MTSTLLLMVLAAALLHAAWNALVKSGGSPEFTVAGIKLTGSILCLFALPFFPLPNVESWPAIFASVVVHNVYYYSLAQAYRAGDLSLVYPLFRGLSPLLVAIGGYLLIGESLGYWALLGLLLITVGLISLTVNPGNLGKVSASSIRWGLFTSALIASYTLIDGIGVRKAGNGISYIIWLFVFEIIPIGTWLIVTQRQAWFKYLRQSTSQVFFGGVAASLAYGLVIFAMSLGAMALVSSLRETSVIFAAIIGAVLLGEPFGRRRILAASIVAAGAIVMRLGS